MWTCAKMWTRQKEGFLAAEGEGCCLLILSVEGRRVEEKNEAYHDETLLDHAGVA